MKKIMSAIKKIINKNKRSTFTYRGITYTIMSKREQRRMVILPSADAGNRNYSMIRKARERMQMNQIVDDINTIEPPEGSVVLNKDGLAFQRMGNWWFTPHWDDCPGEPWSVLVKVFGPLEIIYVAKGLDNEAH